jgi:hypothetical protein
MMPMIDRLAIASSAEGPTLEKRMGARGLTPARLARGPVLRAKGSPTASGCSSKAPSAPIARRLHAAPTKPKTRGFEVERGSSVGVTEPGAFLCATRQTGAALGGMKSTQLRACFPKIFALSLAGAAAFATASSVAPRCWAAEQAPDEVTLKDGSAVRGTLISVDTGDKVVILEAGADKTRTIPWKDVSDIEKGKYAAESSAKPGAAGEGYGKTAEPDAEAAAPDASKPGVVKLHIESPVPVTLMRTQPIGFVSAGGYTMGVAQTSNICNAPCDRLVDSTDGASYSLAGPSFHPEPVQFQQHRGDVTARVDPGSSTGRTFGTLLEIGGGTGLLIGGTYWFLGKSTSADDQTQADRAEKMKSTGLTIAGISAVALVGGIVLDIASAQHVKLEPKKTAHRDPVGRPVAVKPRYWAGEF